MSFYHSEKLQSTKTGDKLVVMGVSFYHSEKLQSTKTITVCVNLRDSFIIAKNYRVLKLTPHTAV